MINGKHVSKIALMELRKICRNKRLLIILLSQPIVLNTILGLVVYDSPQEIDAIVFTEYINAPSMQLIQNINNSKVFSVRIVNSSEEAMNYINKSETRATILMTLYPDAINATAGNISIINDAIDPIIQQVVRAELSRIISLYSGNSSLHLMTRKGIDPREGAMILTPIHTSFKSNSDKEISFFDFFASGSMVFIIVLISLNLSAIVITSERARGTMERIFVTPYRKKDIIFGKVLANTVIAVILAILTILTLILLFNIAVGNILLVLFICILVGFLSVVLGLLISAITNTESESIQLANYCWLSFVMLSNWFWSVESMHPIFAYLRYIIPFSYAISALRQINILDYGLSHVWPDILILCLFLILYTALGIKFLKREIIS